MRRMTRTEYQTARVLACLEGKQMTVHELAATLHMSFSGTHNYVRKLRNEKKIRVCGYSETIGRRAIIIELGDAPDAVCVPMGSDEPSYREKVEALLLAALETPRPAVALPDLLGLSWTAAMGHLRRLREEGKVYIHHWIRTDGNQRPFYVAGNAPDAERLRALPNGERAHKSRAIARHKRVGWAAALGV